MERVLPPGVVMVRATTGADESVSLGDTERPESIGLPLQGIRKGDEEDDTPDVPDIRDSEYFQAHNGPRWERWDERQMV